MSSDFNSTVTFWILWNVSVKPYFNTQYPPPPYPPGSTIPDHEYVNPFYTDIIYHIQKKVAYNDNGCK